jgi:hypothetical protein
MWRSTLVSVAVATLVPSGGNPVADSGMTSLSGGDYFRRL